MYLIYRSCYFPSLLKKFYSSLCCFHARLTVNKLLGIFWGEFHNYLWCFLLQSFYSLLHTSFIKISLIFLDFICWYIYLVSRLYVLNNLLLHSSVIYIVLCKPYLSVLFMPGHQFLSLIVNNSQACIIFVQICSLILYVIYRLHPPTMKFDDILVRVGEFGFYQKRLYLILCIPAINVGCYMMMLVYTMHTPDHR